ncbi:MAG: NYN domain-containing protein [Pseudomonadota bacterium]
MMTSLLLVDVQGFEALAKGQVNAKALVSELSHTMHGLTRQVAVMRAYCSPRVSAYRRTAFRDAGFEIVETSGADETLIVMTLDLEALSDGDTTYEEAILLGGSTDYTALARLARSRMMMVSVADHTSVPSSLESLADGLIDLADLEFETSSSGASAATLSIASSVGRESRATATLSAVEDRPATARLKPSDMPATLTSIGSTSAANGSASATKSATIGAALATPTLTKIEPETKAEPVVKNEPSAKAKEEPKPEAKAEPEGLTQELEDAIAASIGDDLVSDLTADPADAPETIAAKAAEAGGDDAKPDADTQVSADDDSANLDALFADLAAVDMDKPGDKDGADADKAAASTDAPAEPNVDELLTRLMSDDLSSGLSTDLAADVAKDADDAKPALNVVPER